MLFDFYLYADNFQSRHSIPEVVSLNSTEDHLEHLRYNPEDNK